MPIKEEEYDEVASATTLQTISDNIYSTIPDDQVASGTIELEVNSAYSMLGMARQNPLYGKAQTAL